MKVIIAGSRNILLSENQIGMVVDASGFEISEVVSGRAIGIDQAGERYAKKNDIPIKYFSAKWFEYGRAAGYRRNAEMVEYADALIAIWDGESRGTRHTIDLAEKEGLEKHVVILSDAGLRKNLESIKKVGILKDSKKDRPHGFAGIIEEIVGEFCFDSKKGDCK